MKRLGILYSVIILTLLASGLTLDPVDGYSVEATPGEFLVGVREADDQTISSIEEAGFEILRVFEEINVVLVRVKGGGSVQRLLSLLNDNPLVRYVEPNYEVRAESMEVVGVVYISHSLTSNSAPNDTFWYTDPSYGVGQWNMRIIDADDAWSLHMGSRSVVVAVVDTGVRWSHLDLDANYVEGGYDWVNGDDDPTDDNGHGTHVAGIIAAETGNGYGVAGLAQVSILAEKVLDHRGWGRVADLISGILHASDLGVDVINLSLGTDAYSSALEDACRYAYGKGCLLVAAAGNRGSDEPHYPAAFKEVVAVASTYGEPDDTRAPYSNYGDWITLSAPGGYRDYPILSTYHLNDTAFAYMYGTSQAAPHVSGLAALYKSLHPDSTVEEIVEALVRSVEDKGETGWDRFYGYGRINAYRTLTVIPASTVGGRGEVAKLNLEDYTSLGYTISSLTLLALVVVAEKVLRSR